ncbi:hypothetical protein BHU72_00225 [Desulfuribacillus stibiiarsenatis]|uniref:Aminotransferase DegT n=1 Tax=Desulfuribacillus stibiiarsenatis TaxID=1390249 RepID=A0A1E5L9K6_9FIRM|nr:DegT/DnrJ/EryC1/StrS family aminotransferase [Desulfuribacillus stibiiarsenatis]OEH86738.1 hypothetical protein BHU72_00225 [Desulfuribacillus stibiiarsenatis]
MSHSDEKLFVTKAFLPPIEEYIQYLQRIWTTNQLTNNGPLLQELEDKLKHYLGVKHCFVVSNGTLALQLSIRALQLTGEIITTPFSFVATSSSIVWEQCTPKFVDLEQDQIHVNIGQIKSAINKNTSAILLTHVYGQPCDVYALEELAKEHNLKIIYDAAHAFGVKFKGKSLLTFGDISTLSFHATKLFHTVEGGALLTENDEVAQRISCLRNFGILDAENFGGIGINAKNSEFHAAMGLCIFPYLDTIIQLRREKYTFYCSLLKKYQHRIHIPIPREGTESNYAYFPIILESERLLLDLIQAFHNHNIYPRRYFHPSLNKLSFLSNSCSLPSAEDVASKVLCLPFHAEITYDEILRVDQIIEDVIGK